jgi:hypothetical protein
MANPNIPITGAFANRLSEVPQHPDIEKIITKMGSRVFLRAAGIEPPVARIEQLVTEEALDQQD